MDLMARIVLVAVCVVFVNCFPSQHITNSALVIHPKHERIVRETDTESEHTGSTEIPMIYEMRIDSNVSNRYAQTLVTSRLRNNANESREAVFAVILPEKAFISKFVMEIDGKSYEAYIKEKEEAKQIYNEALERGQSAGHVAASARDSNRFTVSVNIKPESKATFYLTYEQLLERLNGQYEVVINVNPGQPVKNLNVKVLINETLPLNFVKTSPIRSGNEISNSDDDLDPRAEIILVNTTSAEVHFNPSIERQKQLAKTLKEKEEGGFSGQFVVQYDVLRSRNGGEILLDEGYFVHFLAPSDMEPLPKYVSFVLDTSGSMYGNRIAQLKVAMTKILADLKPNDTFHIVDFSTEIRIPQLYPTQNIEVLLRPPSYEVNEDNIASAIKLVNALRSQGGTNIASALNMALHLANVEKEKNDVRQPMIVFLTDGEATVGTTNHQEIIAKASEANKYKIPIFSLSFGDGADRSLLEKLSLANNGFARHIYEAADASLQLQDFYRYISSPIMSEVTFKYVTEASNLTRTTFPILFAGSELVVAGKLDHDFSAKPVVLGRCFLGPEQFLPEVKRSTSRLERMWAYITIQQLLENKEALKKQPDVKKRALDLALKYSFVTSVSSLVVVKPNATSDVDPTAASAIRRRPLQPMGYSSSSAPLYVMIRGPMSLATSGRYNSMVGMHRTNFAGYSLRREPSKSKRPTYSMLPSVLDTLQMRMPWLRNVLVNNEIKTDNGNYPLGLNETTTADIVCPETARNTTGVCTLLHECRQMFDVLTDLQQFQKYQCNMRGFAAVCCPKINTTS